MEMACYSFVCLFIVSVFLIAIHLGLTPGSLCVCVAREEKEKSCVFQGVVHLVTKEQIYHNDVSLYTKHHNKSIMSVMQFKLNKRLCVHTQTWPLMHLA